MRDSGFLRTRPRFWIPGIWHQFAQFRYPIPVWAILKSDNPQVNLFESKVSYFSSGKQNFLTFWLWSKCQKSISFSDGSVKKKERNRQTEGGDNEKEIHRKKKQSEVKFSAEWKQKI